MVDSDLWQKVALGASPVADAAAATSEIRVGADLVTVAEVQAALDRFGEAYLGRIFTNHEARCSQGPTRAARLAARFAAKEATIKVLRPVGPQPEWRSIEVVRHESGWCSLLLTGEAAKMRDEAGISRLALSMSHEGAVAGAVVVAVCGRR
jgi:holo-[acyl-carrier protein] synthase